MSKFCTNCGTELKDGAKFCTNCGTEVNKPKGTMKNLRVENRNIAIQILLSLITCGIYSLYWICTMTDDINYLNEESNETSGGMVILFGIITCGIYFIYWNYKMGKKMYEIGQKNGKNIDDNSIIYLVLSLFKLDIVTYCLIQNDLNQFSN